MNRYFLYILSSRHHRFLNIGITCDLATGIGRHRRTVNRRLKKKRVLQKLVYIESIEDMEEAIEREIWLKRASRKEVAQIIEAVNPAWDSISIRSLVDAGYDRPIAPRIV